MKVLYCIHPPRGENGKAVFRQVGVGFVNQDGSINIVLNHQPEVTYQLREKEDK